MLLLLVLLLREKGGTKACIDAGAKEVVVAINQRDKRMLLLADNRVFPNGDSVFLKLEMLKLLDKHQALIERRRSKGGASQ